MDVELGFYVSQVNGSISFHDADCFQVTQDLDSFTQMVSSVIFSEILSMLDACIRHRWPSQFLEIWGQTVRTFNSVWRVQLVC